MKTFSHWQHERKDDLQDFAARANGPFSFRVDEADEFESRRTLLPINDAFGNQTWISKHPTAIVYKSNIQAYDFHYPSFVRI